MKNISGFNLGDRIKMKSSSVCHLSDDVEGAEGTVIDFASEEKHFWLFHSDEDREKNIGRAIVKLDNGVRCGDFTSHREQEGCILAMKFYNAILLHKPVLGIEEII